MGNRATIFVKDRNGYAPAGVYLHWSGREALDWLKEAVPRMRKGDSHYSAARLCGECHVRLPGNLSLGLLKAPEDDEELLAEDFSPGDAGILVYNCETGETRLLDGYLAKQHGDTVKLPVPPDGG